MAESKLSKFDDNLFEARLEALKDTQECIQHMSTWCLEHRSNHKKIVASWLNVFKKVRVEQRLVLFYLANDVIQYSKRKRYEFVESWATALQRATTMVRDQKVKNKILRIFKIWEQRGIYNEEYLSDLSGLLNMHPPRKTSQLHGEHSDEFQNLALISNIKECMKLAESTDKSFKKLPKAPECDITNVKLHLKNKTNTEGMQKEIERYTTYIEAFNKTLHQELKSRKLLVSKLESALKFLTTQRGEVKVVVSAYKNFGNRIKTVKKKLDEITPTLPSPIPSPDIDAPSPERDADLQLPDEQSSLSINLIKNNMNGYSSYLGEKLPFDINDFKNDSNKISNHPIEVIGRRSDDVPFNSISGTGFYKSDSINAYSSGNDIAIPGLSSIALSTAQSGYTSLARSSHQYSNIVPSHSNQLFGNNNMSSSSYSLMPGYMPDNNNYMGAGNDSSTYNNSGNNLQQHMPPPPMPPTSLVGIGGGNSEISGRSESQSNSSNDFNSTWNMNMPWSGLDRPTASSSYNRSVIDTPVSPTHFDSDSHNARSTSVEYNESDISSQDVDHRQIHLPAFNTGIKLGISQEKTRQLDIDHRNLISLTGSPSNNDNDKKLWVASPNKSGDVDYRNIPAPAVLGSIIDGINEKAGQENFKKKLNSPSKNNTSTSSESQWDESGGARYDPTDMVVDMDMSDEDIDDIFKEANEQSANKDSGALLNDVAGIQQVTGNEISEDGQNEYMPANVWDSEPGGHPMNMQSYSNMDMQHPSLQQQDWKQMNWSGGGIGRTDSPIGVPPPPRPPFPTMPFSYPNGVMNEQGSPHNAFANRGRGRGWSPVQYRPYARGPRGPPGNGFGGSPYFNRNGMRPPMRGKFRGNNTWM